MSKMFAGAPPACAFYACPTCNVMYVLDDPPAPAPYCHRCGGALRLAGGATPPADWRTETCGTCEFTAMVSGDSIFDCRRFPPDDRRLSIDNNDPYPLVFDNTPACAEWRERRGETE